MKKLLGILILINILPCLCGLIVVLPPPTFTFWEGYLIDWILNVFVLIGIGLILIIDYLLGI